MRKIWVAFGLALVSAGALMFPPAATPAFAQAAVSVSLFYQDLSSYGRWFQHPRWGWVWFPTDVDSSWRPYTRGHWVWTEQYGWYWVSDEPFGWAAYHYGRWAYDEQYGWIWIPGSTWGPAWVAYRYSDDYVGWAPLPPETLDANYDFAPVYTDLDAAYYQPRWVFIPRRYFLSSRVYAYAVPPTRNFLYIRRTTNVTHYVNVNRVVVNRSIEPRRIELATGRHIVPARINVVDNPRRVGPGRGAQANTVNVFRPSVRVAPNVAPPVTARVRPGDRPSVAIHRDFVAPSERRVQREAVPAPGAPGAKPGETPKGPITAQPPGTPRATPPNVATPTRPGQPDLRRGEQERRNVERRALPPQTPERTTPPPRIATPSTPPTPDTRRGREERFVQPHATPQPRMATPTTPPAPDMRRGREERFVQPRPTPRPEVVRPPTYATPAPRTAPPPSFARPQGPSQPPHVAPSAPPRVQAPPPPRAAPQPPPAAHRPPPPSKGPACPPGSAGCPH